MRLGDGGEIGVHVHVRQRPAGSGRQAAARTPNCSSDLNTLGMFPRISLRGARPQMQRGEEYRAGYTRKVGSRTYQVSAYRESVSNAALTIVAPGRPVYRRRYPARPVLRRFDLQRRQLSERRLHRRVTQNLGDTFSATLMYGSDGRA